MNQDMIMQIVRYLLLIAGGYLVSKGWLTDNQVQLIAAAAGTVVIASWGVYVKWNSTSVPDATAARADVPTISPVTGAVKS